MSTIREVAKKAGVSTATVSRTLSGDESFSASEETRKAVFDAVKELGYLPNVHYKNKINKSISSNKLSVGCIVSSAFGNHEFNQSYLRVFSELEKQLDKREVSLAFCASELELREEAQFRKFFKDPPNGIVYIVRIDNDMYRKIKKIVPFGIGLNSFYPDIDNVTYDKERAIENAVSFLIESGRKNIAYIGGPGILKAPLDTSRRFNGYLQGLKNHDIPMNEEYVKNCMWIVDTCYEQTQHLLGLSTPPNAIICGSDNMIFSVLRAIYEKGLHIPNDIAVLSCEQLPISEFITPALTTIKVPISHIAKTATELLIKRINGYDEPPMDIIYRSQLIIKDSTP